MNTEKPEDTYAGVAEMVSKNQPSDKGQVQISKKKYIGLQE